MLITPFTELGKKVRVVDVLTGDVIPCGACDTEEGWIDLYLERPGRNKDGHKKAFIDRKAREIARVRLHAEFDVIDRTTAEVLYRVRWTMTAPPRCYIAK